ncbi:unnamed protein product [Parascedosporium putredinis]|uniref:Acyl-CoA oxidase C-terminal domain-containing protein n=1 Tax=Parascedosporium putredinis TaxID=1442378 RepID=A0A9P1MAE3_9PEZI|nr:unnamed protein product [Parascedosporium putredinis]CAI7993958.1 unnamed protein product [Parascedosporium putredinis]
MASKDQTGSGALLADLHAISCALKAFASTTAAEGLEGDNYMLTQQVARYLLKAARGVLAGKPSKSDISQVLRRFIERRDVGNAFDVLSDDQDLVDAFGWRVAYLTLEALRHRDEDKRAWNSLLVDFWRLSTAFAQYLVVKTFLEALRDPATQASLDQETQVLLHKQFQLFALSHLTTHATEFFACAAATVRQLELARTKRTLALLGELRPHAVRLVDAWQFSDWALDSSLGRYDGKVYEDMFHRASELNPSTTSSSTLTPSRPPCLGGDTTTEQQHN